MSLYRGEKKADLTLKDSPGTFYSCQDEKKKENPMLLEDGYLLSWKINVMD